MQPTTDQEFKTLIPPLTPDEYAQLEQNILQHGCRDPIVLWRGKIIGGHNRHTICAKHGLPYKTITQRLPSRNAAKLWILENQLGRRNLTNAVRIELAALKVALSGRTSETRKTIAREANLSERTVQQYMHIKTHGDPELLQKVLSGNMKIGTARRRIQVTRTTMEDIPFTPPPQKCLNARYAGAMLNNLQQMVGVYGMVARYGDGCEGMGTALAERVDRHEARLRRLVGR